MVFYFKARSEVGDYIIYMGLDKHENEDLIKYGLPEDIWFHVDKLSSAHVYLRMHKGQTMEMITPELLEDCAQLVKANSIQGNKLNNLDVVYTPWYNLRKTPSMDVGQVGFHNSKLVRTIRIETRKNEIVNRLNKTKTEQTPDLKAEREAYNAAERNERKQHTKEKKRREEIERLEKERQAEIRSYTRLMVQDKMTSNKDIAAKGKSLAELEEDFISFCKRGPKLYQGSSFVITTSLFASSIITRKSQWPQKNLGSVGTLGDGEAETLIKMHKLTRLKLQRYRDSASCLSPAIPHPRRHRGVEASASFSRRFVAINRSIRSNGSARIHFYHDSRVSAKAMCLPWLFGGGNSGPEHRAPSAPSSHGAGNAAHGHAGPPPSRPHHSQN